MTACHAPAPDPTPAQGRLLRLVPSEPALTSVEACAVAAGRREAFRAGWDAAPRGRIRTFWGKLLGSGAVTPFADEQLEMLRLFACMMRRDDRRAEAVADQLLALGMSRRALHQAIALALA